MRNMNLTPEQKKQNDLTFESLVSNLYIVESQSIYRANSIQEAITLAKKEGYNPEAIEKFNIQNIDDNIYQIFEVISQLKIFETDLDEHNFIGNVYNSDNINRTLENLGTKYLDHRFMISSIISSLQEIEKKLNVRQLFIELLNEEIKNKKVA